MTRNPLHILLRPGGRLGRVSFVVGVVLLVVLSALAGVVMRALDPATSAGFWWGLGYFLLFWVMLFSVFGQRLHDMGRTVWPLWGVLFAVFLVMIGVMLAYGGAEYFGAFSAYDREDAIDPAVVESLRADYEAELAKAGPTLNLILSVILGAFTVWLALTPGKEAENRWGAPV